MAPLTRSGGHDSLAAMREESWEFPSSEGQSQDSREDANGEVYSEEDGDDDDGDDTMPLEPMSMDDVEDALYPLKRIVDRVGKQIEQFAANLDQFKPNDGGGSTRHQKACRVIREYQKIALETAEELAESHETHEDQDEEEVEALLSEVKSWHQEAQTWDLFASILSIDTPENIKRAEEAEKIEFAIHRYSTDTEKWDYFLATDIFAQECVASLTWLQRTADSDRDSIEDTVTTYMGLSGDEDLANSQALLYTKEAIKAQKRLRSWPQPLDPDDPGIDVSLTRPSDKAPLITQLDPDAASRQGRKIRDSDQMYDRAGWIASWEMLRRGRSWNEIMDWSTERSEFWRAGSLKGANVEDDDPDGLSRFKNSRNRRLWQQMCLAVARDGNTEAFEGSVYGLLGGETGNVINLSPGWSWSDRLFIEVNGAIVGRYSRFLHFSLEQTCPEDVNTEDFGRINGNDQQVQATVERLKRRDETKAEARLPLHLVQGAIMAKDYDELFEAQGMGFSAIANATEASRLYPKNTFKRDDDGFVEICGDRHLVRIVTHMMLILQPLGVLNIKDDLPVYENNTVAYIQFLQQAGRLELIPLYASRLSKERSIDVLSRVFVDITDHKEREQLVRLMQGYGIDVATVLQKQALNIFQESLGNLSRPGTSLFPSNTVLSQRRGRQIITDIKLGFIGTEIDHLEELLIRSLEWHRCLDGHWDQICTIAITCYERCFALGRLATAREMCKRFFLQDVSKEVTGIVLSHPTLSPEDIDSPKESSTKPHDLHELAGPWRELEQLTLALDAIESWRDILSQLEVDRTLRENRGHQRSLRSALAHVTETITPLLVNPTWLLTAPSEDQLKTYHEIRIAYLPEIILAYNTVLNFAGHFLSRESLLDCLNLAISVGESEELTNVFVEAGRMRELVDGLAISSRAILTANERGASWKGRTRVGGRSKFGGKGRGPGENSGIWSVGGGASSGGEK